MCDRDIYLSTGQVAVKSALKRQKYITFIRPIWMKKVPESYLIRTPFVVGATSAHICT